MTENYVNLTAYGSGYYCVRAANQRGGLGAATQAIHYTLVDAIELEIKKVEGYQVDGVDYGWSTICLPFNARIPEGVKVYAATADETQDSTAIIKNFTMTLTEVDVIKVINANKGYVVYGPVGKYAFHSTSRKSDVPTILKGNPTSEYIFSDNNNGYVLSYKSTWELGLYKYTGSQLSPYRAWLPQNMVSRIIVRIWLWASRPFIWSLPRALPAFSLLLCKETRKKKTLQPLWPASRESHEGSCHQPEER